MNERSRWESRNKKRSINLGGRETGIGLEDALWFSLKEIAVAERVSASQLIIELTPTEKHANLSSAIRIYVLDYYQRVVGPPPELGR